jgi:hypothetical protein
MNIAIMMPMCLLVIYPTNFCYPWLVSTRPVRYLTRHMLRSRNYLE